MAPRGSGAGERCRSCAGLAVHVVFVSGVSYINVFSFSVGSQLLCIKQIVKKVPNQVVCINKFRNCSEGWFRASRIS